MEKRLGTKIAQLPMRSIKWPFRFVFFPLKSDMGPTVGSLPLHHLFPNSPTVLHTLKHFENMGQQKLNQPISSQGIQGAIVFDHSLHWNRVWEVLIDVDAAKLPVRSAHLPHDVVVRGAEPKLDTAVEGSSH